MRFQVQGSLKSDAALCYPVKAPITYRQASLCPSLFIFFFFFFFILPSSTPSLQDGTVSLIVFYTYICCVYQLTILYARSYMIYRVYVVDMPALAPVSLARFNFSSPESSPQSTRYIRCFWTELCSSFYSSYCYCRHSCAHHNISAVLCT